MCLNDPPTPVPVFTQHVAAHQDRRQQPAAHGRLRIDGLGDQRLEHERALRVADQHEAAAVVVPGQVGVEGSLDVVERERRVGLGRRRAEADAVERHLPVHRREHSAVLRVPRRLVERDRFLLRVDLQIGVAGLLVADRGIDVEAVDLRLPDRLRMLDPQLRQRRGVGGGGQARACRGRASCPGSTARRCGRRPAPRQRTPRTRRRVQLRTTL